MTEKEAKEHIIDALDKSNSRIDKLLDRNASDEELKKEIGVFNELDKTRIKYKIPYIIQKTR